MIIHPDGRIEGTPEELAAYQREVQAAPAFVEQQVPDYIRKPSIAAEWTLRPWEIWCGGVMYDGPELIMQY